MVIMATLATTPFIITIANVDAIIISIVTAKIHMIIIIMISITVNMTSIIATGTGIGGQQQ